MINVSEIKTTAPLEYKNAVQQAAYNALETLEIPFWRVDTDEAITMEDCRQIDERLGVEIVKSLFLCNRQKTKFYLFITTAKKAFCTKQFGKVLGIPRVSFAPAEMLDEILGVKIGATTVFGLLVDTQMRVELIVDNDVLRGQFYGCSDGTTTGYMKFETQKLVDSLIPYTRHSAVFADFPEE